GGHLRNLRAAGPRGAVKYAAVRVIAIARLAARSLWMRQYRKRKKRGEAQPQAGGYAEGADFLRALIEYVPREYEGEIVLFRASEQPVGMRPDPSLGWASTALGGLRTYEVPGT